MKWTFEVDGQATEVEADGLNLAVVEWSKTVRPMLSSVSEWLQHMGSCGLSGTIKDEHGRLLALSRNFVDETQAITPDLLEYLRTLTKK